jgi:type III secretion protein D
MFDSITMTFLTGPLRGHHFVLAQGHTFFGDENADVLLPLDTDAGNITLNVSHSGVYYLGTEPCWVGGESFGQTALPLNKVIDICGMIFIISSSNENVPDVDKVKLPGRKSSSQVIKRTPQWRFSMLMLSFLLISLLAGISYSFVHQETEIELVDRIGVQQWLSQQVTLEQNSQLVFQWLPDGVLKIDGHCSLTRELNNISAVLRANNVFYQLSASCDDQIINNIHYLLNRHGFKNIGMEFSKKTGAVKFIGDIKSDEHWRSFIKDLESAIEIKHWEVVRNSRREMHDLLKDIKAENLIGKISIERMQEKNIITGQISSQQKAALTRILKSDNTIANENLIFQSMPPQSASADIFPEPVVSIGGVKERGYIELSDGRRLQIGAMLLRDYEIVAIDSQLGIDVMNRENLLHYTPDF